MGSPLFYCAMKRSWVHWIPVTTGLPADPVENVLVIIKPPKGSKEFDPEDRWMEFGTFSPGEGWVGNWMDYLGEGFVVTHWSPRPKFPADNG